MSSRQLLCVWCGGNSKDGYRLVSRRVGAERYSTAAAKQPQQRTCIRRAVKYSNGLRPQQSVRATDHGIIGNAVRAAAAFVPASIRCVFRPFVAYRKGTEVVGG